MTSLARPVAFAAAVLIAPAFAADAPAVSDPPGLWLTLKNECAGAAAANVADKTCAVAIGTASFVRTVQSGEVPAGFTAKINACADKAGDAVLQFSPLKGATAPIHVTVKPNGVAAYPKAFCKK
jgi:glutamine phosphoribosylpyrophosphate amidotransferase